MAAASEAEVAAAQSIAADAVVAAVSPLISEFEAQCAAVTNNQKALSGKLEAVIEQLQASQAAIPRIAALTSTPIDAAYPKKLEALKKRLDGVNNTMQRVMIRVEHLQEAWTHAELQLQKQRKAQSKPANTTSTWT
jgi:hypothetical protein